MNRLLDNTDCDLDLPSRTGVVVIGAGITGLSTALAMAEKGMAVTVLKKGRVGAEQASRNWGWCRTAGRDLAEVAQAMEGIRMWGRMAARIGAGVGLSTAGVAYVAGTQRDLAGHAAWLERARDYQVASRLLDTDRTAALLHGAGQRFAGCLYTASDGRAEPRHAVPAMAAAARRLGVTILEGCAARRRDLQAGRVAGGVTERGRIACEAVVLAGGAWSRLFRGNQGVGFPQSKVLGSVLRITPMAGPEMTVGGHSWAFRKRADGGYNIAQRNNMRTPVVPDSFRLPPQFGASFLQNRRELKLRLDGRFLAEWRTRRRRALDEVSPFEAERVLDPASSAASRAFARKQLVRALPVFAAMQVAGV